MVTSTILENLSSDDLKSLIQDSVRTELSKINLNKASTPETEQPISQTEALAFLGKSRQTLNEWRRKGVISGHRLGGRIFYFKSELVKAMK